jgi:hypothetical protein
VILLGVYLVAVNLHTVEVTGSNPVSPTSFILLPRKSRYFRCFMSASLHLSLRGLSVCAAFMASHMNRWL